MAEQNLSRKTLNRILAIIILLVLLVAGICSTVTAYGATVDYYEIKIGSLTVANVENAAAAQAIVDGVRETLEAEANGSLVSFRPGITIESCSYRPKMEDAPVISYDTDKVVGSIVSDKNLLTVTTQLTEEKVEAIPFETKEEETEELFVGEEKVSQEGQAGERKITEKVTFVNGEETSREEIENQVVKEPVEKIILKGTKERPVETPVAEQSQAAAEVSRSSVSSQAAASSDGAAAGQAIVDYAMQFIGNPYVYGGTSLTNGCDCSGFIYAVYTDMGYSVPRSGFKYSYPQVSTSEMRPGDIICYPNHYSIYMGDGMEVQAKDYGYGICTEPIGRPGQTFIVVRIIP